MFAQDTVRLALEYTGYRNVLLFRLGDSDSSRGLFSPSFRAFVDDPAGSLVELCAYAQDAARDQPLVVGRGRDQDDVEWCLATSDRLLGPSATARAVEAAVRGAGMGLDFARAADLVARLPVGGAHPDLAVHGVADGIMAGLYRVDAASDRCVAVSPAALVHALRRSGGGRFRQVLLALLDRVSAAEFAAEATALGSLRVRWFGTAGLPLGCDSWPLRDYADALHYAAVATAQTGYEWESRPHRASGTLVVEWSWARLFDRARILGCAVAGRCTAVRERALGLAEELCAASSSPEARPRFVQRFYDGLHDAWTCAEVGPSESDAVSWARYTVQLVEDLSRWLLARPGLRRAHPDEDLLDCGGKPRGAESDRALAALRREVLTAASATEVHPAAVSSLTLLLRRLEGTARFLGFLASRRAVGRRRRNHSLAATADDGDDGQPCKRSRRSLRVAARAMQTG